MKVSMYVKSRFEDLKSSFIEKESQDHSFEGWLVTNTRFTTDALDFGKCAGLKLISWDYPSQGNLRQLIDESGFHPITTMKTLSKKEKEFLLDSEIILCRNLISNIGVLEKLGIKEKRIERIKKEAKSIIKL